MLQEASDGAPSGIVKRRENEQLLCGRAHQRQCDLMTPRIFRRVREACRPLRLVEIAERIAARHAIPVVNQAHYALRRRVVARKFNPADQGFRAERHIIDVLDFGAVVDGDELIHFGAELNQSSRHAAGDFFEIAVPQRAVVCRRDRCRGGGCWYLWSWRLSVALGILLLLAQRLLSCSNHCLTSSRACERYQCRRAVTARRVVREPRGVRRSRARLPIRHTPACRFRWPGWQWWRARLGSARQRSPQASVQYLQA